MVSLTEDGHTFSWRFEREMRDVTAAPKTGVQMHQERLIALAQRLPKFVGRTIESLRNANLAGEIETAQERRADLVGLNAENLYENVLDGVSVRYCISGNRLKEDIILANADALKKAAIRLPKTFDYEVTERSELLVKDKATGDARFVMRTPSVYDSSGLEISACVTLTDVGDYIRLEYRVDSDFLANAIYPVTIDPIVQTATANVSVSDAYIWKKYPNKNFGNVSLMRCGTGSGGESISLIKFNKLISLKASDTVISAVLRVKALNYPSNPEIMGCYPIKTAWTETGVTWNSMTPADGTHISKVMSAYIPSTTPTYCWFRITSEYRSWYLKDENGNSRNFGVALRRPPEVTTGGNYVEWTSCKHNNGNGPCMFVNYVSHAGRKSWWQYESMSAGRAGSAHVDLFNGNLVFEHADGATTGNRMPISVSHVYNSCLSESNPVGCGKGWRTNMHQSVRKEAIGSTHYYIWTDGDATEHFFAISGSQPYADAEGISLKLATASTELTITDKSDTKLVFPIATDANQKYLLRTEDACGNTASLSYDSTGKLIGITDGVGREAELLYNEDGLLSRINIPGCSAINYTYSGEQLTGIHYADIDADTIYEYEETSNMLVSAVNYDGIRVDLTYEGLNAYDSAAIDNYAAQVRRIVSMETRNGDIRGAKQLFDYELLTTKVTAVADTTSDAGKTIAYQFNDAGNVVCCFDELGFARSNTFSSSVANQQTSASRMQKAVINLLGNIDFSSGWSSTKGADADAVSRDTSVRCLNMPSVKIVKMSSAETVHAQTLSIANAGQYTFSAYVKNETALASGGLFLRIRSGSDAFESRAVTGTTTAFNTDSAADGWDRLYVTANFAAAADVAVELVSTAPTGDAWFACPQLETGAIANHVNLLLNGDFAKASTGSTITYPSSWEVLNGVSSSSLNGIVEHDAAQMPAALTGHAFRILAFPYQGNQSIIQYVNASGKSDDVFVVGGWCNAQSVTSGSGNYEPKMVIRFLKNGSFLDCQFRKFTTSSSPI